ATIPQIGGMYEGDRSRKTVLVNYGFRLPSALDNRPLNFDEFMRLTNQTIYVSATPAEFEIQNSAVGNKGYIPHRRQRIGEAEVVPFVLPGGKRRTPNAQRPTPNSAVPISRTDEPPERFDVDTPGAPLIVEQIIRPTGLLDPKITMKPLKDQIDETIELCRQRVEKGERFLRSQTSLIQTAGRAARHINGEVVLFADTITQSMEALISISEYRREKQMDYDEKHRITPQTVRRAVQESLHTIFRGREVES